MPKIFFLLFLLSTAASDGLFYDNFSDRPNSELTLDGTAVFTPDGALQLTHAEPQLKGHAFHKRPFHFRNSTTGRALSFSSSFVFAIDAVDQDLSGNGIAFVVSPIFDLSNATGSQYLGVLNQTNNGDPRNRLLFVELDTIFNPEFGDIDNNHVGININSLRSNESSPAGYYDGGGRRFRNLTLVSGNPMQVWVEYDGIGMRLSVTITPVNVPKPATPLLSATADLSSIVEDFMYVGFSSSTGSYYTSHYILGWSFQMNGKARPLVVSDLPTVSTGGGGGRKRFTIWVTVISTTLPMLVLTVIFLLVRRMLAFAELLEDWEKDYSTHRFSYRDLHRATAGFSERTLVGAGGFGRVYRGVLGSRVVAVKRVSRESRQGAREFVAEVASLGRLRHRNLVPLLGYCRRKGELLLVYEFMPNGSLDRRLFRGDSPPLTWEQRVTVVKGVACALLYLHEEWEKVVIHRDIKASNVMLDEAMRGRLGDFGLARLHEHGAAAWTTRVVGTMGYVAPEVGRTGRVTKASDVYAFGVFVLEVVCGRRPVEPRESGERLVLVDWVLREWTNGRVGEVVDRRMAVAAEERGELERVVRIGLLCSHPVAASRPDARRVVEMLEEEAAVPEMPPGYLNANVLAAPNTEDPDSHSGSLRDSSSELFITTSVLWNGR